MKEGREINCDERLNRQISSDDMEDELRYVSQVPLNSQIRSCFVLCNIVFESWNTSTCVLENLRAS